MVDESFTVVASTNVTLAHKMSDNVRRCRWAPGRIAGVPVATTLTVTLHERGERGH
jgi:hypothetical protein